MDSCWRNAHLRAEVTQWWHLAQPDRGEEAVVRESLAGEATSSRFTMTAGAAFDAWDVDPFHLRNREGTALLRLNCEVVTREALRAEIAFAVLDRPEEAACARVVRLDANARRLEFHTEGKWHETHKMLKVAFPVDVRAMNATYEMQFGYVERPTHFNTMYDSGEV
jgi:alpha-mannosidase